ncbi:alcohol dehydrogenase [Sphingomonas glacialis]|uniref:Alcohol dehydrogenase n=1 Tax=Sphingomonas glacialis TaxID=658225 RepID=A0ABQ3LRG8_9SPHN|nr:zinc-binding dehydrogenase [Sphingomonas glacialis]GHH23985.1 alcohol dehydrogenase [Sphingomonas glacialis]
MRGVVFTGDRTLELMDFPDPEPGPEEVVLAIRASGMCGSDLKFYRPPAGAAFKALGLRDTGEPIIAGHEPAGEVVAVGRDVDPRMARIGMRAMVYHYDGCHACPSCRTGWWQMCENGPVTYGLNGHGGHAPYMKVPARTLVALPEELSFATGAAISCGTGTAYQALVRAEVSARDTVAVFGQGPVGLSATQLAAAMGAQVIAVDISGERVERALEFGAVHAIDASVADPVEAIMALTGGRGVSKAFDTSGVAAGRLGAVRSCGKWATACFVGEGGDVTFNVSPDIMRKQLTIMGSWTFSNVGQAECTQFIANHGIEVDRLFTDRWTIEEADAAYRDFDQQLGGKAVFI